MYNIIIIIINFFLHIQPIEAH